MADEDHDSHDGPLYACAAYSGDLPWGKRSDPVKRREFWDWWLREAAPAAYDCVRAEN